MVSSRIGSLHGWRRLVRGRRVFFVPLKLRGFRLHRFPQPFFGDPGGNLLVFPWVTFAAAAPQGVDPRHAAPDHLFVDRCLVDVDDAFRPSQMVLAFFIHHDCFSHGQ